MNEEGWLESSGSFVRRVSALARKSRSRAKRDQMSPSSANNANSENPAPEHDPFVNRGLELWNQQRREWTTPVQRRGRPGDDDSKPLDESASDGRVGRGNGRDDRERMDTEQADVQEGEQRDAEADEAMATNEAEELYNELLAPQYAPFPRRIPLGDLIEVLLDVWEQDGVIG